MDSELSLLGGLPLCDLEDVPMDGAVGAGSLEMLADGDLEIFASVPLPPTNDDHSSESEPRAC
eukprot:3837255-Alexandrium_andersonii.AAC.1